MKSKALQKIILSKCQNGDTPIEIYRDLNGGTGLRTIKQSCQMIRQSGSIALSTSLSCPCFVRTKSNSQKVKHCLRRKKRVSAPGANTLIDSSSYFDLIRLISP